MVLGRAKIRVVEVTAILARLLGPLGLSVIERVLDYKAKKADSETERLRIDAARQKAGEAQSAQVIATGMQNKLFWIPWLLAAVPTTAWYAWGVLDSMIYAGAVLPDVAALPPQLKGYADVVWSNLFYAGAAVKAAEILRGR